MFKEIIETINWGEFELTMKTGKIAKQSDGAVIVSMGDTVVMCTAVSAKEQKVGVNFFPLTVHYREMAYAAGKIPGGFFKREGRATERETLVSRLIDRPLRPLFHSGFFNETQVICTVLSYDDKCPSDILAIIGASAALAIAGVPYTEVIAAAKVGYIDNKFILNPSSAQIAEGKLDLIVAGTDSSVMMVESEASELSEEVMLEAIEFGHTAFQPVIKMIEKLAKTAGKEAWPIPQPLASDELIERIANQYRKDIEDSYSIRHKQDRYKSLGAIYDAIKISFEGTDVSELALETAFHEVKGRVLRHEAINTGIRIDDRKLDDIRPIETEVCLLPKAHGSALFTRGETQALVVATLGTGSDEQIIDGLDGDAKERFLLHYIFPPYSVGEATPFRAPGRREIGHGKLAWRALKAVLPSKVEFPYTIRVVSEITECNGSSSMATVCGSSLAMMDAGVPLKAPVSGIAMGLIKEGNKFVVLSDILGDEDHLGDMDFKVAGTASGITALQMDIKISGINLEIMKQALAQANKGRLHILSKMALSIESHKTELSKHAPAIQTFKIHKDKIREVIGSGGKVIKEICELTGAKIDITDDGTVQVAAVGSDKMNDAIARIKAIAMEPEVGGVFEGTVAKVLESGAFINYLPGKDGFIHISEIADERIASVSDHLTEGQKVTVKIIGVDPKGKAKLSMRLNFDHVANPPAPREDRGDRGPRDGNRRDDRAPRRDDRERSERPPVEKTEGDAESFKKRRVPRSDNRSEEPAVVSEKKYFK